jgi:hypothetical protein
MIGLYADLLFIVSEFKYVHKIHICIYIHEPRHDKTNIVGLRLAWIQTSLRLASAQSDKDPCCLLLVSLLVIGIVREQDGS